MRKIRDDRSRGGIELPSTPDDDAVLLRQIASGNRDALALAFDRFRPGYAPLSGRATADEGSRG